jgi:hypothetical protein
MRTTTAPIATLVCMVMLTAATARAEEERANTFYGAFDQSFVQASSPLDSWVNGGPGKLRFDEPHDGALVPRGFVDYRGRIAPTLLAHATINANSDGDAGIGVTEAYLEYRPVPASPWAHRWRVGAFYPHVSLENAAPGWRSPYMSSSSAINTWIGEEFRTIGAELAFSRALPTHTPQRFGAQFALYGGNDVAGGLLAERGWAVHDRQTALFENVAGIEPFHELDNRPGYYVGVDWRYADRARVQAFHYDNLADPESARGGQYGWRTFFDALGGQLELPGGVGLIAQWMHGTTIVGPWIGQARAATDHFDAGFLMATRAFGPHRASLRYDDFSLSAVDPTSDDNDLERGHAWAASYGYAFTPRLGITAEWMQIDTRHGGWMGAFLFTSAHESLSRVGLTWRFGKPAL